MDMHMFPLEVQNLPATPGEYMCERKPKKPSGDVKGDSNTS